LCQQKRNRMIRFIHYILTEKQNMNCYLQHTTKRHFLTENNQQGGTYYSRPIGSLIGNSEEKKYWDQRNRMM